MTTYKRVVSDAVLFAAVASIAILLGVLGVKSPFLAIAVAGSVALVTVAAVDATLPAMAWLVVAPFVQALEPTSPLIVFTIAFHRFLLPIVGASTLLGQSIRRRLRLLGSEKLLLAFLVYAFVSLVMSVRGTLSSEAASMAQRTYLLAYVVPFGALLMAYRVPVASHRRLLIVLTSVSGAMCVGGIFQSLTGQGIFPGAGFWQDVWEPRAVGSMGNPAVMGYVAHVGLFSGVYVAARYAGWRFVALLSVASGVLLTILTYTRSVWVALALGVVTVAWLYPRARAWVVGGSVVAAAAFLLNVGGFVDTAFLEERAGNQENVEGRVAFGSTGIRMFKDDPVFGQGFGTYDSKARDYAVGFGSVGAGVTISDTSHNTFLTILAELGGTGLLLYGAALWAGLRRPIAVLRGKVAGADLLEIAALMAGVVSYFVTANLIDVRFFSFAVSLFWFNVGLVDAAAGKAQAPHARGDAS